MISKTTGILLSIAAISLGVGAEVAVGYVVYHFLMKYW